MSLRTRTVLFAAAAAAASLALAGCASNTESSGPSVSTSSSSAGGSGSTGSGSPSATKQSGLAALVPADIAKSGKLIVGVNVPYSPNEYLQGGQVVGFDVDLLDATAKVLGLSTDYRQADFDKIIPAVKAGTYNIGMSSFTDNKEREQTVDFVDYFSAGILWASPKGKNVNPLDACGLTVAVQTNTTEQLDELPALSKKCTSSGKPAIKVLSFDNQDDATTAVVLGRADAMSADSPVTSYAIKQAGGKLQAAGSIREAAPYGWPIAKGSTLVKAMQKALQSLIDDGTYDSICKKWGVQAGEIKKATVNGAIS